MCEQAEERAKRKALRKEWNILWTAVADNDIEQTEAQTKSNVARSDIDVVWWFVERLNWTLDTALDELLEELQDGYGALNDLVSQVAEMRNRKNVLVVQVRKLETVRMTVVAMINHQRADMTEKDWQMQT